MKSILAGLQTSPVLVSTNKDIYTNLALEHWLYTNLKFVKSPTETKADMLKTPVILIWTDEPCVVIGRHQNPWIEANLGWISDNGIKLARRHSGGGCVYHDENNINISVIGERSLFENRQQNLRFVADTLKDKYGIDCEPTSRHDLVQSSSGLKISGSAAKLGTNNCYHHFTILVDSQKDALYSAIRKEKQDFITSNSSLSQRSKVVNLKEIKHSLEVRQVIGDIAEAFRKRYSSENCVKQPNEDSITGEQHEYESLKRMRDQLTSWDWIYGMTPRFKLEREFNIIVGGTNRQVRLTVQVNKGSFESISILGGFDEQDMSQHFQYLLGTRFTYKDVMVNLAKVLQLDDSPSLDRNRMFGFEQVYATFLLRMVHESNY